MDEEAKNYLRDRFHAQLQALCQPAEAQLRLYPDCCQKVDELAVDFGNHWESYDSNLSADVTSRQRTAIEAIEDLLDAMGGKAEYWTKAALATSPEWQRVRLAARQALEALDWPVALPEQRWF